MKEAWNLTLACSICRGSGIPIIVEQATQNPRSWVYIIIYSTSRQTIGVVRFSVFRIMYKHYMSIYRCNVLTMIEIFQISTNQKQSA